MAPKRRKEESTSTTISPPLPPGHSSIFYLELSNLATSYGQLMSAISSEAEVIITLESPSNSKGVKQFCKISDKLYTPSGGTFLVQITPDNSSPLEDRLTLLFRWKDLYFEAFHSKGKWYRMGDAEETLPPRSQLNYPMKEHQGIVKIPFETTYASVLGKKSFQCAPMGPGSFHRCYKTLMTSGEVHKDSLKQLLGHGFPLALPVMGISEPLRFPLYQEWLQNVLILAGASDGDQLDRDPLDNMFDKVVPAEHSDKFYAWGTISDCMYEKRVTLRCNILEVFYSE
uniref:rRNA N-glycosylase n=1 Tax=Oryza rufipogon TaxID=4529 RepID=A0A0E0QDZ4_ORYRU